MTSGWLEPTSELTLRYGSGRPRHAIALVLLFGGGIALQLTSAYTLGIAVGGFAASVAGWAVVPARGWRRSTALLPGLLGVIALLSGAESSPAFALTVAAWLLVRERPPLSWIVLILPIGAGIALGAIYTQYGAGVEVAIVLGTTAIASAWLAALLARSGSGLRRRRSGRTTSASGDHPDHVQRNPSNPPVK